MSEPQLPLLLPTLPGKAPGVVGFDPLVLQCSECGALADAVTIGVKPSSPNADSMVLLTSGFHFHAGGWPDGTNPRLCRSCRVARGCCCASCASQRRSVAGVSR